MKITALMVCNIFSIAKQVNKEASYNNRNRNREQNKTERIVPHDYCEFFWFGQWKCHCGSISKMIVAVTPKTMKGYLKEQE